MSLVSEFKNSFVAGELGQKYRGRIELGLHKDGMKYLKSGTPRLEGPIDNYTITNNQRVLYDNESPIGRLFKFEGTKYNNGKEVKDNTVLFQDLITREVCIYTMDDNDDIVGGVTGFKTRDVLLRPEGEYNDTLFLKRIPSTPNYIEQVKSAVISPVDTYTDRLHIKQEAYDMINSVTSDTCTILSQEYKDGILELEVTGTLAVNKHNKRKNVTHTEIKDAPDMNPYIYDDGEFSGILDLIDGSPVAIKDKVYKEDSGLVDEPTFTPEEEENYIIEVGSIIDIGYDIMLNEVEIVRWYYTMYHKKFRHDYAGPTYDTKYINTYNLDITNNSPQMYEGDDKVVILHMLLGRGSLGELVMGDKFLSMDEYIRTYPSAQDFLLGYELEQKLKDDTGKDIVEVMWQYKPGTNEIRVKFYDTRHTEFDPFEFSTTRTIFVNTDKHETILTSDGKTVWNDMKTAKDLEPESITMKDPLANIPAVAKVTGEYPDKRAISYKPELVAYLTDKDYGQAVSSLNSQIKVEEDAEVKKALQATKDNYVAIHNAHSTKLDDGVTINTYVTYEFTKRPKKDIPGEIQVSDELKSTLLREIYIAGGVARWREGDIWVVTKDPTIDTTDANPTTGVIDLSWQPLDLGSIWFKALTSPRYVKALSLYGDRLILANYGGDTARVTMSQRNNFKEFKIQGFETTDPVDTKIKAQNKTIIRRIVVFKSILFYTNIGIYGVSPDVDSSIKDVSMISKFIPSPEVEPAFLGEEMAIVDETKQKLFSIFLSESGSNYELKDLTLINSEIFGEIISIANVETDNNGGYTSMVAYTDTNLILVQYYKAEKLLNVGRLDYTLDGKVATGFRIGVHMSGTHYAVNTSSGKMYTASEQTTDRFEFETLPPREPGFQGYPSLMIDNFVHKSVDIYCSGEYEFEVNGATHSYKDNIYFDRDYSVVTIPHLLTGRNEQLKLKIKTDKPVTIFALLITTEV